MQKEIGFDVPEIAEILKVRNGADGFKWDYYLFDCEGVISDRNVMLGLMDDFPDPVKNDPKIKQVYWNKKWVQFATDGGGNLYCIDYDPAPGGTVGQVIFFDHETSTSLLADSLEQWLDMECKRANESMAPASASNI